MINLCLSNTLAKVKFCKVCRIYRPPRTTHCKCCDRCVSQFDHHCTLLGTCIGRCNYRSFFFFLLFGTIFAISTLYLSVSAYLNVISVQSEMQTNSWLILTILIIINIVNIIVAIILPVVRRHDRGSIRLPQLPDMDLADHKRASDRGVPAGPQSELQTSSCEHMAYARHEQEAGVHLPAAELPCHDRI